MGANRDVVALIRVSTETQAKEDRGGVPRQMEVIKHLIRVLELNCVETVILKGVSGTEVRGNKEIQRILRMIESKQIGGLVVADLDRLIRPAAGEDYAILDPFLDAKATIFASGQEFDFKNPVAHLMVKLIMGFSEFERTLILARTSGAIKEHCRSGRHPFGPRQLPLGITYDRLTNNWGVSEKILPILEAYRLVDEEGVHNINEVARRVGVHQRALHNLIRNRLYSGWRVYDTGRAPKKKTSKSGRRYKPKVRLPEEEVIKVQVLNPPPVSRERFARVQAALAANYENWKAERDDRPAYNMLRSVARCGHCDSRLYFSQDRRRPNIMGYYFCSQHYYKRGKKGTCGAANQAKHDLDDATNRFVTELLRSPKTVRAIVSHREAAHLANQAQPELKGTDPATFEARRRRLKDGLEGGVITVAELRERLAKVQEDEDTVKRLAKSQAQSLAAPQVERLIRTLIKSGYAFQRMTNPDDRLRVIQRLFAAIYYENGQITKFRLQPSVIDEGACEVNQSVPLPVIFADKIFVLLEPFPPRKNSTNPPPAGHKQCPGCNETKPESAFWKGRPRCKSCLGLANKMAYRRRRDSTDVIRLGNRSDRREHLAKETKIAPVHSDHLGDRLLAEQ
jgi:DNA invertase Pin-like site-specific DNA recombinase